ncbi:hypothetical protein G5V59_24320 [Nocardioides sp. W3-2-3]|nr:hypothetical protein [Nocardioides convexus]
MGLIVLVVLGHTWALLPSDATAGHLYDFVYLWHMPAFVFLSGYLSRRLALQPGQDVAAWSAPCSCRTSSSRARSPGSACSSAASSCRTCGSIRTSRCGTSSRWSCGAC